MGMGSYDYAGNCNNCGGNLAESTFSRTISCDTCSYEMNYETGEVINDGTSED